MKEFDIKTKIYFGQDSLDRLKAMPYQRVMIIADPFVVSSGDVYKIQAVYAGQI